MESVESELETAKDRLRKNVEAVEGINKSILVFESRHVETVERMKEVLLLKEGSMMEDPKGENVGNLTSIDQNMWSSICKLLHR